MPSFTLWNQTPPGNLHVFLLAPSQLLPTRELSHIQLDYLDVVTDVPALRFEHLFSDV